MSGEAPNGQRPTGPSARVATLDDLDELTRLDQLAREHVGPHRGGQVYLLRDARPVDAGDSYRADVTDEDRLVAVGGVGDTITGFVVAEIVELRDGTHLADVTEIFVEEPARDVGVGEALMDAVVAWARARGCRGIDARVLPGDRNSKNFFETFGLVARAITVHRDLGS